MSSSKAQDIVVMEDIPPERLVWNQDSRDSQTAQQTLPRH